MHHNPPPLPSTRVRDTPSGSSTFALTCHMRGSDDHRSSLSDTDELAHGVVSFIIPPISPQVQPILLQRQSPPCPRALFHSSPIAVMLPLKLSVPCPASLPVRSNIPSAALLPAPLSSQNVTVPLEALFDPPPHPVPRSCLYRRVSLPFPISLRPFESELHPGGRLFSFAFT